MKQILGTFVALALFASTAFAQTPAVPIGPSGGGGGGGGGGGSGTVTSVGTSCGVSGGPITTSGTITGNITANDAAAGSAYTFLASDCGKLVSFSDGTARAPSLPSASFVAGNFINIVNAGAGAQTITPTAGTICGAATLVLQQNQGTGITFDGTNWQCSGGPYAPVNSGTVPLARMPTVLGSPPYITGASMWYGNPYALGGAVATSGGLTANSYYCTAFWIYGNVTIKALGARVIGTSTGNSIFALQGAIYSDLVTTGNVHRPGALIDYADGLGGFPTGSAASVSSTMHNTTDALTGPAMDWVCIQKFELDRYIRGHQHRHWDHDARDDRIGDDSECHRSATDQRGLDNRNWLRRRELGEFHFVNHVDRKCWRRRGPGHGDADQLKEQRP